MKEGEWRIVKAPVLSSPKGMQNLTFKFLGDTETLQIGLDAMPKEEGCFTRKN